MPPKPKEATKKPTAQVTRPAISNASLVFVPNNAVEGYQERIEENIDWTLLERAARLHKIKCTNNNLPSITFKSAFQQKIKCSILHGFLDESSTLTLQQHFELLVPIALWEKENFANDEEKICFESNNNITDDLLSLIKTAMKHNNRDDLKKSLKAVQVLRIDNVQMTELDAGLSEYKNLGMLNLSLNFLGKIDGSLIPPSVRVLELHGNRFTQLEDLSESLPENLLYIGLSRNLMYDASFRNIPFPHQLTVLDLADNDIYELGTVLDALEVVQNLSSLLLVGNPCSVCAAYARTTISRLPRLQWLDNREVIPTDRPQEEFEPHPDDLRSAYFNFTVIRIMSVLQPPKPEKGALTTFHVELELPLLDSARRNFLMFRRNESLTEMLPPPEEDEWPIPKLLSSVYESKMSAPEGETSTYDSDIYRRLTVKNSREVKHFTTFESNKIQWNKVMNFQEPTVRIFCPNLKALRDTFRTVVTVRLVYSVTNTAKQGKLDKKSIHSMRLPNEQRAVVATIKCSLKQPDWSQTSQHFHWDDSLRNNEGMHWGDGDLSVIQYTQAPVKAPKTKADTDASASRQPPPDNLTCHFAFGIDTLKM